MPNPADSQSAAILEFDDVSIGFDGKPVLSHISFKVTRGETLIILGPAGCGKSVLMKLADGLIDPDSGSVRVFGEEINAMPETKRLAFRKRIGIVFQESALFDSLSVADNVAYLLHEEHMPEAEAHAKVVEALKFVDLSSAIDKFPAELSGGMRRRVSIARAIITGPDLILYDSATGGLDPITSTTIIELIVKQRDVSHTTSVLITHRLQDAFTVASHRWNAEAGKMEPIPNGKIDDSTRFIVINENRILFDGSTHELVHTQDPWLKAYLS
jgi:phospholipid/cholesterol/gamma-HCH transport system ATP-binding protein